MKIMIVSLMLLGTAGVGGPALVGGGGDDAPPVQERPEPQVVRNSADADALYEMVKQARAALRETRTLAGLSAYPAGPQVGRPASRERREVRGEHGGRTGGEEGGAYLAKMTRQDELFANGARLVLQFNPNTQVFAGSVTNTTANPLSQVRVEIHLDNGTELGPTKRVDVGPGQTIPVELGTFGEEFSSWISHPEAGIERGHGAGSEEDGEGHGGGEGRGEHGGREGGGEARGDGVRPQDAAYRPLYNQLRILRGEMHAFEAELKTRSR
ncbi:hypothetical protein [Candidatus Palauibacter soopunensis]|uniref:hypothetical protein n=1 Tax=Candidatus Palauibacter soopunensis TaxID=3056739 RepID=UPI0023A6F005|nr:hypothetical protein [Candidatus Palauibacter soopunensis]MDE2879322.1 hypothetical protein [Candidatus Palauibacter soopunensis]